MKKWTVAAFKAAKGRQKLGCCTAYDACFARLADEAGVPCIRVGLQSSENLADESKVLGGANHSAIGELAMGELFYERICGEIEKRGFCGGELTVYVPKGCVSKAVGQKKRNKQRICQKYGIRRIKVLEKNQILGYNIILEHNA